MNKILSVLAFFLICFFTYGFYLSQFELNFIARNVNTPNVFYDYKLSSNIHTNQSIGSEPLSVIVADAKKVKSNLILITDLNPTQKIPNDSYLMNLGVLQGAKYGYKDSRLIYYSPTEKNLGLNTGESHLQISDLLSQPTEGHQDQFLALAHPYKLGFSWSGDLPAGLDAIEIINLKSLTQRSWEKSKLSTVWSLLLYPFNPKLALIRLFQEPSDEINLFDQTAQRRKIVALSGAEASARAIPFTDWLLKFPSYERSLSITSNHLLLSSELTGTMSLDNKKVLEALKLGNFYICFDALGDSTGFQTYLIQNKMKLPMGSEIKFAKNLKIYFKLPAEPTAFYEVILFKNGERIDTLNIFEGFFEVNSPGIYRLQVRISPRLPLPDAIKWLTWIYTNNYYVN